MAYINGDEILFSAKINGLVYSSNLLPSPYNIVDMKNNRVTHYGLTFIVNTDGTILVNGTAEERYSFAIVQSVDLYLDGVYTLSGLEGGANNDYRIYLHLDNDEIVKLYDAPVTFTYKGNIRKLCFYFEKGNVFDYFIIKPMLNKGETAMPYEPPIIEL